MANDSACLPFCGTPEDLFSIRPDAEPGLPVDALHCALARAQATLHMVMTQFDGTQEPTFSSEVICNALWGVEGNLQMIEQMVKFAWAAERGAR